MAGGAGVGQTDIKQVNDKYDLYIEKRTVKEGSRYWDRELGKGLMDRLM